MNKMSSSLNLEYVEEGKTRDSFFRFDNKGSVFGCDSKRWLSKDYFGW